jgi:hypothetical protein
MNKFSIQSRQAAIREKATRLGRAISLGDEVGQVKALRQVISLTTASWTETRQSTGGHRRRVVVSNVSERENDLLTHALEVVSSVKGNAQESRAHWQSAAAHFQDLVRPGLAGIIAQLGVVTCMALLRNDAAYQEELKKLLTESTIFSATKLRNDPMMREFITFLGTMVSPPVFRASQSRSRARRRIMVQGLFEAIEHNFPCTLDNL